MIHLAEKENNEIKLVRLELSAEHQEEKLVDLENRVTVLEERHGEQVNILGKLSQTVETLATTVKALNDVTHELAMGHAVVKARFNWIIGILSGIGAAVLVGLIDLLLK